MPGLGVGKSNSAVRVKAQNASVSVAALANVDDGGDNNGNQHQHQYQDQHYGNTDDNEKGVWSRDTDVVVTAPLENTVSNGDALYSRPMGKRVSVQPKISPERLVHHRNGSAQSLDLLLLPTYPYDLHMIPTYPFDLYVLIHPFDPIVLTHPFD